MDVNGKVAVVTGGASGIGQAVARRIAGAGGKVVIFDLNEEAGNAMVAEAIEAVVGCLRDCPCVHTPVRLLFRNTRSTPPLFCCMHASPRYFS